MSASGYNISFENIQVSFIGYNDLSQQNIIYPTNTNIQYEAED